MTIESNSRLLNEIRGRNSKSKMTDRNCPFYECQFWDLMAGGGGDENCLIQREVVDQYGGEGYALCNSPNHQECPRYLNKMKIEMEREKIINSTGFGD